MFALIFILAVVTAFALLADVLRRDPAGGVLVVVFFGLAALQACVGHA